MKLLIMINNINRANYFETVPFIIFLCDTISKNHLADELWICPFELFADILIFAKRG